MKLVYGVGLNDANYNVSVTNTLPDGEIVTEWCPYYTKWKNVLARSFSKRMKELRPFYKDITCCQEWLIFSNFKSWMKQQDWEGKQLDKDLLIYQNKIYSPETCVFVDRKINQFLVKSNNSRGKYPLGVSYRNKNKDMCNELNSPYRAVISHKDKFVHLGDFSNPIFAHRAWQKEKIKLAKQLAEEQQDIRVKNGLLRVASKIQNDYDNDLETKDF